jgi:tetratricopeptide (TPR) repeat protein
MALQTEHSDARRRAGLLRTVRAGFVHHQSGRLDRAERLYRRALDKDPDDANALHLLGVVAYQTGDIAAALRLIGRALPTLPQSSDAFLNYGNALRDAGRLTEAAESYRRAIALKPDYGMAHSNLACALNERREFAAGLESSERAIELIPEFFGAHLHRAAALIGLERYAEAEAPLLRALEMMPARPETHRDLGWVLAKLGRYDEAVSYHRRAISLDPDDAAAHYALAATLYLADDLVGSEAAFRHARDVAPDNARTWQGLGNVLRSSGRFEEALACFRRALELDPDLPETHQSLAATGQQATDQAQLQRLRVLLANTSRQQSDRIAAGFALGMLLDNADRYDEAFPCFAEANTLHRQQRAEAGEEFDAAAVRRQVDRLTAIGTPNFFSAAGSWGNPSQAPVFIIGMPRSGTTLVEQIAASHSRVFGAGERPDIDAISDDLLARHRGIPVEKWDAAFARELADRHVAHLQELGGGAVRVIDKMPDNIFALRLIAALFPSAKVILCQRDLRDVCLSCYFHWFTRGHLYSYDLADCGARALEVNRLANHWLRVLPLEILVVDYEKLVADLERESRRLIEFLGLDWEPACLDFHRTERPIHTASAWQVRQPLFSRSVGRWRHYEQHLKPLLEILANRECVVGGDPSLGGTGAA